MVETKRKNKCIKLLGSIVLGLAFLCLGIFAGFGGKIEEFVKGAGEPTTGGTTSSYENAMIYVDSGATTNITGGSVGAMESGNSVYVADGGTLNVTGGTVSGNIYNGGTLNYTAGTLNSVTLASGKYITFKGNPSSTISITLDSPSVGTNIGYLDGITSVTLSRLSVTNLPANTKLRISGNYITIAYVDRTVSFEVDPSGYGTVSQSTLTLPHGSSVSVSGSTLSYGSTSITATPAAQTAQYTYSFDGWYVGNTQITNSRTITANTTITARFTRTTRTYTVTIHEYNASYGSVSPTVVEDVPYGTEIYRGSSITQLYVGETLVTATPNSSTAQYSYSVSSWREDTSSGTTITTTGFTLEGDKDIYVRFTKNTRSYYIYAYARYSTSSSGTNSSATTGITGGIAKITYGSTYVPTPGSPYVKLSVPYNGTVTLTADAETGYVFVGWYSNSTSNSAVSTSSSYSLRITGTTYRYAFFKRASYTITIAVSPSGCGSVSQTSVTADYGTSISASGNTLSIGSTDITATPASQTAQYTYSFSSWSNASGTVTGARTITANFSRTTRTYTVTIHETNASYGSVSPTVVEDVPYGTEIYRGSSIMQLYVGETLVTVTPNSSTAQYSYGVSSWREDSSSGTTITTTGFTLEGDKDIYVIYTRRTMGYNIYAHARYSTSSSGTIASATAGVTGGTVSITFGGSTVTTTDTSSVSKYVPYDSSVTLTAEAKTGYVFVGWYSRPNSTSLVSTSESYSLTVTGTTNLGAFFKRASYTISVYTLYSSDIEATISDATAGTNGGSISLTYNSSTSTTSGNGPVSVTATHGETVNLRANAATGYTFVGYYYDSGPSRVFYTNSTNYNLTVSQAVTYSQAITFYAFFRRTSYTITLTVGDGQSTNLGWFVVAGAPYAATYRFKVPYGETFSLTPSSVACSFTIPSGTVMLQIRDNTTENITMYNSNTGTYHYLPDVDTLQYTVTSSFTISFIETTYHTVTIQTSNSSYGTVSRTSVSNVPLGGKITLGTASNILSVNGTTSTATASSQTSQYTYSFSSWRLGSTSGTQITSTGTTISGDTTIYAVFTRSARLYTIRIGARYSTKPFGTNPNATSGITGGYATLTYGSSTITTTSSALKSVRVTYNTTLTFIAYASSGYTFVGWYASTTTTTAASSREQLAISATSNHTYYAFFRKILSGFTDFDPSNLNITSNEYKINNLNLSDIDLSENTMDNESIAIFNSKKQLLVFIDKKIG